MIRVVSFLKPRIFLFENVRGIMSSKWTSHGENGEIFKAVLGAFNRIKGYHVNWDLIYAKDYGVPQSRPRILIVGVRNDVYQHAVEIGLPDWRLWPRENENTPLAVLHGFLPQKDEYPPPTLPELLSDLVDPDWELQLETKKYPAKATTWIQKRLRKRPGQPNPLRKGATVTDHKYSTHTPRVREKFQEMIDSVSEEHPAGKIPRNKRTGKFNQRVLPRKWNKEDGPTITITSLPDDFVHYEQPRILTVREWARLQTFPDWYIFHGPRTTGGRRRAGDPKKGDFGRHVPRYTQIGNAVPVALAEKIGLHFRRVLLPPR